MTDKSNAGEETKGRVLRKSFEVTESIMRGMIRVTSRLPWVQRWHPWYREDKTDMRWLPINQDIEMPEDVPMPLTLLDRLIEEASHRCILDYCGCRNGFRCENYPIEIGCLLMGDSALEGKRYPFREVGIDEAKEHARRAVDAGLVPVLGKARADNFIYGIKDRSRLLTACFCCECCCISRFASVNPLKVVKSLFPPLEGISIKVTDACIGCGICVDHCYIGAIRVSSGRARMNEYCRACGRCATVCPEGAVEIRVEDPDYFEKTLVRIRSYVKHD
jgi:UDP-glucose 4-epimerase